MNNNKKENLIIFLVAFSLIILIIAGISLVSGTLLKMFGISYSSIWYFILFMIFVTVFSYPLNALVILFIRVLLIKELITEKTAIISFVVLDTLATYTTLHIVDLFMDSVTMTPLASILLGLVFALLSLPDKRRDVKLVSLDKNDDDLDIKLRIHQEQYVLSVKDTLALARANASSKLLGIYTDNTLIGLVMYYDLEEKNRYILSQFMIDKKYQSKGFGKEALTQVLKLLREDGKYSIVALCVDPENFVAINLYERFGFSEIARNETELIMTLNLVYNEEQNN